MHPHSAKRNKIMIINSNNNQPTSSKNSSIISEVDFPELEQTNLNDLASDFSESISVDYSTKDWENDFTKSYEWDY
jgi:hypothetical protein